MEESLPPLKEYYGDHSQEVFNHNNERSNQQLLGYVKS